MKMKKSIALVVSLILVLTVTVGGTLAFLIATSESVKNTFTPSKVTTEVDESFENNVKTNVSIKNTGDTEAYIRAAVVVTWQNNAGNVYGKEPVLGTDYTMDINTADQTNPVGKWTLASDGFYYWSKPVAYDPNPNDNDVPGNCFTGILITEAKYLANAPEGYSLCIEILGSGIQSLPTSVVASEWSNSKTTITVHDNGTLNVANTTNND